MFLKLRLLPVLTLATLGLSLCQAFAGDIKINIPRRSKLTPVQRLNRDGVEAVWNGEPYRRFREQLYSSQPPPSCRNCGLAWSL